MLHLDIDAGSIAEVTFGIGSSPTKGFSQAFLNNGERANVEAPTMMTQGRHLRKDAMLNVACFPLPTLDDDHSEVFVHYSLHQAPPQKKKRGNKALVIPKRQSMRILQVSPLVFRVSIA
ncbi:hypothetical protein L3X38_016501 [Prunus dulcis]|uniref:Uncharacterized protein n=1 Tax=Prunus dulcis TaxID=3755 RepID=A0AAD4W833_PRUDU|nr:hypothetical protein L3X38_016501 [Prunus dulcis]